MAVNPSDDPFALLPFAVAGLIVGIGLALGGGYGLSQQWRATDASGRITEHVEVEGCVEWAGWRQSAVGEGPGWYLQVRLVGDERGFLVAASSIPASQQARLEGADGRARNREVTSLKGKQATIIVDSGLVASPGNLTPYLSALRVEGETIVPLNGRTSSSTSLWRRLVWMLLLGIGLLAGVGLSAASVQHIAVCVRHGRP